MHRLSEQSELAVGAVEWLCGSYMMWGSVDEKAPPPEKGDSTVTEETE